MLKTSRGFVKGDSNFGQWRLATATMLGIAMVAVLLSPGAVAPFTWGETRASQASTNWEVGGQAGVGPNGEIYALYWELAAGGNNLILAVDSNGIYPEGGPVFTTHTTVNDGGANVLASPFWVATLVVAPNGDLYAAWRDNRDAATTGSDIRVARSTNGGTSFTASTKVSDYNAVNVESYPSLAIAPNGDIWAAWGDDRSGDYDVYVASSTDQGATWGANIRVNSDTTNDQYFPRIAFDRLGTLYVVWSDWRAGPVHAYIDYTTDDGVSWKGNTDLSDMGTNAGVPDIAVDARDVVHVTWQDYATGNSIWYKRSFDHGGTYSMAIRLDNGRDQSDPLPRIATSADGVMVITWEDRVGGNPFSRYAMSTNWGMTWGDESAVSANQAAAPNIVADKDGNFVWAWSRNDGVPNNGEVYVLFADAAPRMPKGLTATDLPTPGSVRLSWLANLEMDIAGYQVIYMSGPLTGSILATLPPTQISYDLAGLANGEHTYAVEAFDLKGQHSAPALLTFTVGPTDQDLINQLQNDIINLQNQLNGLNASIQDEVNGLKTDIQNLQNRNTELQTQLTNTKNDLASASNLNMLLIIIIIVLLIVTMVLVSRKPKMKLVEPVSPAPPPPVTQYQQPPPPQQPPYQGP